MFYCLVWVHLNVTYILYTKDENIRTWISVIFSLSSSFSIQLCQVYFYSHIVKTDPIQPIELGSPLFFFTWILKCEMNAFSCYCTFWSIDYFDVENTIMAVQLLDILCFLQLLIGFKKNNPFAFLMYFMLSSTAIILSKSMEINLPASQSNLPFCSNLNFFYLFIFFYFLAVWQSWWCLPSLTRDKPVSLVVKAWVLITGSPGNSPHLNI